LEEFAYHLRPLNPDNASLHYPWRQGWLGAGYFQRDCGILWNVVFGLVLATVAVDHHGRRPFLERLAKRVHARYVDWYSLDDASTPPLLGTGVVRWDGFDHTFSLGKGTRKVITPKGVV
jgi:hypothetical protein